MIGKILGNRYEIVEKIGGGGMALVYKAKCNLLNRYVAVKILRSEFTSDKDIIDKFRRESQAAASLSHPNIVNIYDVGEEEDIYYIVMEYVKGQTLKQLIQEKDKLSLQEIINFTKQIAMALQHAHYNHVIHRDIKPHNILIAEDNRAKVTDFGIALAATTSTITNMGSVIGSVHYFSPEQARGGYIDEKSDLYSLGIVMYEMATGKVPFEGESPISVALKHIQQEPVIPSEVYPEIAPGLEEIILKLIEKDQASRYQNTQSLIEDLETLKEDASANYMSDPINHEDSPTQIIPRIKEEDIQDVKKSPSKSPGKNKKKNNKVLIVSAVAAALIAALLFTFGLFYVSNLFKTEEVEVPNLVGKSIDVARVEANQLGLELKETSMASSEVPINEIIDQTTPSGRKVKPGFAIEVVVSTGPTPVKVPNLVYKEATDAPFILENEGLQAGTPSYVFDELPIGTIIEQDPKEGTSVPEGTTVTYTVSQGPRVVTFPMPKLVGLSLEVAKNRIQQYNLQEGSFVEEHSDEHPEGQVFFQNPAFESEVQENDVVDLIVSKGPKPIEEIEEPDPEDNNNDEPEDSVNTSTNNLSTQNVTINFKGHTGVVDIVIKSILSGKEVVNIKHDVAKDGSSALVTLTGSGAQEFELYVNGRKQDNIKVNFKN
ncbi:serine/threonine protein kinase [Anaerovirgula multivorans]|uniref:non-specific serine/threonine protein kinase n=1 Tax=Anaerovirgula multivorans TaxID=312168 RepID=A0A239A5F5_9FIRM|nr:Stk1 family PASTA domain-containing Ser/Thr kinase [Anaerovirgula multivorans]SNR90739.1 serine/threonine protein kinase [Anaerovirgula multivorans]